MENPLRTWWKVRKWFRFPKPSIYFGPIIDGLPIGFPDKWIELHCYDVTWKDKYNSPRFEFVPQINLELFKKWQLLLTFQTANNDVYWETILDIVYYNVPLQRAIEINTWEQCYNKKELTKDINAFTMGFLTPKGEQLYLYAK